MTSAAVVAVSTAAMVVFVGGPANAALPAGPSVTGVTGSRPSATQLQFSVSDQVSAAVDVATGNLRVSTQSLSLVGVTGPVTIGQSYNSLGTSVGSTSIPAANKWTVGISGAGYLSQGTGVVIYTAGDGATWAFTPVSGSTTAFTSPAGFKSDLVVSAAKYVLTDRVSQQSVGFTLNGQPTSITDRNGNATTIGYTGANPTSVVSGAGPVAARTASLAYNSTTRTLTASQSSGALSRSVKYVKNSSSNLTSIVDANGKTTSFTYAAGSKLSSITSATGGATSFTYDANGLVTQVSRTNTTAGAAGTSVTRIQYTSAAETLVADANTNQSLAVSAVPHTTYAIDATTKLVSSSTDAMGRVRAAIYTTQADVATATSGGGTTAGTTTAQYEANSGDSRTSVQRAGGATSTAAYANTAAATKHLPSSTTGDSTGTSTFSYNGSGNALSSTDSMTNVATLTYNADGTVATGVAAGNGANQTVFAHNADKQLSTVTPVTGAGLGVRTFTYDDLGRTKTATNGRGVTLTYNYDLQDRLLTTAFSDATPTVTNTYTDVGQIKTRADSNGTTTYTYDQLNQLFSRVNTFAGGTIGYRYDKASNLTQTIDGRGTTTNAFDVSGVPTGISYQIGANTQILGFATDDRGRRTDTWLQTNSDRSVWKAHTNQEYDTSGRVTRVTGETNDAGTITLIIDISYSYCANTGGYCTDPATDRSKLQSEVNNITGQTTAYTYDAAGRLTGAAQTGGTGTNNSYAYTYDARGNRLTATVTGSTASSQSFTVNAANQITTAGYTFDGAGNMTADTAGSYAYTGADQMKSVTQGSATYNYKYAGTSQNEVLEQQRNGTAYQLVYGRSNQVGEAVIEQVKVGANTAYVENDPVTGQPLMLRTSNGVQALYVYSGTGSPVALLTDSAYAAYTYTFDPYGVPTLTASTYGNGYYQNPFLFAGSIQDRATGWVHYGARWYNPATGRWTQQDTLDNPLNPVNANRYAYAGNDPINGFDPTGRSASGCAGAIFFGAAAGVGIVLAGAALVAAAAPTAGLSVAGGIGLVAGTSAAGVGGVGSSAAILTECE